jgi:hypothetical protein
MSTVPDSIKSAFPKEIELGRDVPDYGATAIQAPANKAHEKEKKKDYPTLYIRDVPGLEDIPKEGYALIYFRRRSVTVGEDSAGEDQASADLEVQEICLPPTSKSEEDADLSDAMQSLLSERNKASDEGDDSGEESGEDMPDDEESE